MTQQTTTDDGRIDYDELRALLGQGPAMTDDDLKARTSDLMHALAASDADVANITAEWTDQGMRVTFDLLKPDDAELAREVIGAHAWGEV